jgi:hypothetical protein
VENSTKHLKTYVIDRYEGAYAVLEDKYGRTYDVPRDELPPDTREGDVLNENDGIYVINEEATKLKRAKLRQLKDALTNKE